jgi:hypothetical protein
MRKAELRMAQTQVYHTMLLAKLLKKRLWKAQQEAVESELDAGRAYERLKERADSGIPMTGFQEIFHDTALLNVAQEIGQEFGSDSHAGDHQFQDWDSPPPSDSIDSAV